MSKGGEEKRLLLSPIVIAVLHFCSIWVQLLDATCMPRVGCSTAVANYVVQDGDTLDKLVDRFQTSIAVVQEFNVINDPNNITTGQQLLFPFSCDCVDDVLGHSFSYLVQYDDRYNIIANSRFEGLSTVQGILQANVFNNASKINPGDTIKVPVNCSCGNPSVSPLFGLFATYSALNTDTASSLATAFQINRTLLEQYNPTLNWNGNLSDGDIVFIPVREALTGLYPAYDFSGGGSSSSKAGSSSKVGVYVGAGIGVVVFVLGLCCFYLCLGRKRQPTKGPLGGLGDVESDGGFPKQGILMSSKIGSGRRVAAWSDFRVDKSVEFSFEELSAATDGFNVRNKVGEGGYGAVYLAILRGQKMAVKRMNLQATREFLAELQVLTRVHHTNLVKLIGYCTVESLFLIYEYVENGTLDRHLHRKNDLPLLSWAARVQIALDSARGLEYIHEHTRPTYIHRDVKSSNILIDQHLHAKVADFGLTKLTEAVSGSYPTRVAGTFGYMSPEYARFGDVSPKVDVYAFGIVLFEIISAKDAIVRGTDSGSESSQEQRGLVTMFEEVLMEGEGALQSLIDPALEGNYPLESVRKMAQLAGSCTQENPELRPSMRTLVVALMSLSTTTQQWDMSPYLRDRVMFPMSGR